MKELTMTPIGEIEVREDGMYVALHERYRPGLKGLEGFSHLQVLWWFDKSDTSQARRVLEVSPPYKAVRGKLGVFATRSPRRPNPIALTTAEILGIDREGGRVRIGYTEADDGSPVLDLKPYSPSLDRVENPSVPEWCAHWPRSLEESATFDWGGEMKEE